MDECGDLGEARQDGGDPAVDIRDLTVVRGGATILRGLSLRVPTGVVYGLVGPSGSGKTTLIRALIGRQRIAGGTFRLLGRAAGDPVLRRLVGYMPQLPAVYLDLTGRENLEFFAAVYGTGAGRVEEVLHLVDLEDVADRIVLTYSGGQQRRVALATALLPAPRLMLLDEPTVGLDPRLRRRLWSQFRTWAAGGTTLLVSTHVMDEAARTDRLIFLSEGQLVAEGTPEAILARTGAPDLEDAMLRLTPESASPGSKPSPLRA